MDATVKSSFWSDPRVEELSAEGKLAALWLMTNSQRDLLGFTRATARRFQFETGLDASHLEAPCKALPSSFKAPSDGVFFCVNFLRHQFGQGGEISLRNKVIQSAIKKAKTLPSPLQGAFLDAYPELTQSVLRDQTDAAAADPPSKPLGRDQSRAEHKQSRAEQSPKEGKTEGKPSDRQLAEKLVAACPRPDLTIGAIDAAIGTIVRHRGSIEFSEILAACQAATQAVKQWPADERVTYTPEAAKFFREDLWRKAPESWQSRRQARKSTKSNGIDMNETNRPFDVLTFDD